jgi:hypothetical protein
MRIPEFKASRRFVNNTKVPCLVAKIRNSEIGGIGNRYIAENRKDPLCSVYLRSKATQKISPWQQKLLDKLFREKGLAKAVAEGMREFEKKGGSGIYDEFDDNERQQVRKVGFVPYVFIDCIVIDDIEEKVLIGADSSVGILHEHGITIYLDKGKWRFKEGDHLNNYAGKLAAPQEAQDASRWEKQWETVFPASEASSEPATDPSLIHGVWRFSRAETMKALQQWRLPKNEISAELTPIALAAGWYFSKGAIERLYEGEASLRCNILRCERNGNLFKLRVKTQPEQDWQFWCDGKRLVGLWRRRVFTRAKSSYRKGG